MCHLKTGGARTCGKFTWSLLRHPKLPSKANTLIWNGRHSMQILGHDKCGSELEGFSGPSLKSY